MPKYVEGSQAMKKMKKKANVCQSKSKYARAYTLDAPVPVRSLKLGKVWLSNIRHKEFCPPPPPSVTLTVPPPPPPRVDLRALVKDYSLQLAKL